MASWDIQPDGVRAVLGRVDGHAEDLAAAAKSFGADVESAANATASSIIMTALSEFATAQVSALSRLGDLLRSAENGAVGATNAYLHADQQMAENAQRASALAAGVILPSGSRGAARLAWRD
ncbi:MAG: hypothetical protein JWO63_415 [Frankiales bacterium]|nr:hypothetical protein [Frankiales bacterium]